MKKYTVTFWRSNPQLKNGGYKTTRTVEAKNRRQAVTKAEEICGHCVYGGMTIEDIREDIDMETYEARMER